MPALSLPSRLPAALTTMLLVSWCALQSASASNTPGEQLQRLLQAGQVDKAEHLLAGLEGPRHQLTRFQGLVALQKGEFAQAEAAFKAVLKEKPEWKSTWLYLAQAQLRLSHYENALTSLEQCADLGERRPGYYRLKARAHQGAHQPAEAYATLQEARQRFPDAQELALDTLLVLVRAGLHHAAIGELRALLDRTPLSPEQLTLAARIARETLNTPAGLTTLELLVHQAPDNPGVLAEAGYAWATLQAPRAAADFFGRAHRQGGTTAFEAADQWRLAGDTRQALRWNAAVSPGPRQLTQRLAIYLSAEDYDRATALEPLLADASALNDTTLYHLAYAFLQVGELKHAAHLANQINHQAQQTTLQEWIAQSRKSRLQG